jgi:hypothetical protein
MQISLLQSMNDIACLASAIAICGPWSGLDFQNHMLGLIINIVPMSGIDSRHLSLTLLRPSKLSLASTTKSFLTTHYARPRFPVGVEDICLPNGLKLGYFDTRLKIWPARLPQAQNATFSHHCQFAMPANSPFSSLNISTDFAMDLKGPSSYEIVASQSRCPSGLNIHEYMSFQTLFSGKSRRWPQILVELGSSNLNFSTEATTTLMTFLALQIGLGDKEDPLGVVHGVFRDEAFCKRLVGQLDQRLDGISSN